MLNSLISDFCFFFISGRLASKSQQINLERAEDLSRRSSRSVVFESDSCDRGRQGPEQAPGHCARRRPSQQRGAKQRNAAVQRASKVCGRPGAFFLQQLQTILSLAVIAQRRLNRAAVSDPHSAREEWRTNSDCRPRRSSGFSVKSRRSFSKLRCAAYSRTIVAMFCRFSNLCLPPWLSGFIEKIAECSKHTSFSNRSSGVLVVTRCAGTSWRDDRGAGGPVPRRTGHPDDPEHFPLRRSVGQERHSGCSSTERVDQRVEKT